MITTQNYIDLSSKVDFSTLPDALKNGDKLTKSAAINNWASYNSNENIKRVVDIYMQKLDEFLAKNKKNIQEKSSIVKPEKENTQKKKKDNNNKPPKKSKEQNAEGVEKVVPEIQFIKRYVNIHGKTKSKDEVLRFLNSLQKAIIEKRIRKTSAFAKEIENIQTQLIKCANNMEDSILITIDKNTLEKYSTIAQSQKTLLSISYIKQYISIHGKKNIKDKAKSLFTKIKNAIAQNKIPKNDPYIDRLNLVLDSLDKYIKNKTNIPQINSNELNGLKGLAGVTQKKNTELNGFIEQKDKIISTIDLLKMVFKTIGLKGKYYELIGDPCVGFLMMVYGLPKSGKSTLCIDFAKYLAANHGKVLYCAIEEKFGYTLQEKVERLDASHPNFMVTEDVPSNLSAFDFVFIDSVTRAGIDYEDIRKLHETFPKTSFICLYHTTKEGNFKGKNDEAHEVDVIVQVNDGIATSKSRFNPSGSMYIWGSN